MQMFFHIPIGSNEESVKLCIFFFIFIFCMLVCPSGKETIVVYVTVHGGNDFMNLFKLSIF